MLLRHKTSQITFLHVYHHASMVLLTDYFYHLAPWPAISFPVMINAFVHVCLYAYYGSVTCMYGVPFHLILYYVVCGKPWYCRMLIAF